MAQQTVAVIMGGTSFERAFSLKSGKQVVTELEARGYRALPLDADENLVETLRTERPDVAVIALHGAGGEDGTVGALLEFLDIPYVGSRPQVCRTTWDKSELPYVMQRADGAVADVSWPAQVVLTTRAFKDYGAAFALDLVPERLGTGFPLAVKPARGGSAMGFSRVDGPEGLGEALMGALAFDNAAIVQQFVEGTELAVTVYDVGNGPRALPPVEIAPKGGAFDTEARTEDGRVEFFNPVRPRSLAITDAQAEKARAACERAAVEIFNAFGCRDLARIDMIWTGERPCALDLKVFPGLSEISLVPLALEAEGYGLGDLLEELVQKAIARGPEPDGPAISS